MTKTIPFNTASGVIAAAALVLFLTAGMALAAGPAPVNLGTAGNFTILSQTGITDTGSHASVITGDIGSSPITAAAMNTVFCSEIIGKIYGVDAAYVGSGATTCSAPGPGVNKTLVDNAVGDMVTAYNNAAGVVTPAPTVGLGAGNIGGMTLAPGLYKWSTGVTIPTSVTLSGGANDVWIFQIAGNLSIASAGSVPSGVKVILAGGAKASNVFWQVGGPTGATLGTYSTFNGTILSAKQIIIQTGAVLNGRALAQTQVTLDANTISAPSTPTTTPPTSVQVHLFKYIDGVKATVTNTNGVSFPMFTSTFNAPFTLGPTGWFAGDVPYEASTAPMPAGSSYAAEESTSTSLVGVSCDGSHTYALAGYSTGETLADAAAAAPSLTAPNFSHLTNDEYVVVWNRTCPGSLKVTKNTIGGDGTFLFTGKAGSFSITTSGGTGSQTLSLVPGTYTVTETANPAWTMNSNTCQNVVVARDQTATCAVTNTKNQGIFITNSNSGSITNTTVARSSTGGNYAGGSVGGRGGSGGSALTLSGGPRACTVATTTIVSDTTTLVVPGNTPAAAVSTPYNAAWTASIPGAFWIWSVDPQPNPVVAPQTIAFEKSFTVPGTVLSATLDLAADNTFTGNINGTATDNSSAPISSGANIDNFHLATQHHYNVINGVVSGSNNLHIEVTNVPGSTDPLQNPGGLLYKLVVTSQSCGGGQTTGGGTGGAGGAGGSGGAGGAVFTGNATSSAGSVNIVNTNRVRIR